MKPLDYVYVSTGIVFDRDMANISCNAFRCFIEMICISGYDLSDGVVDVDRISKFSGAQDVGNALQELKEAGFIKEVGDGKVLLSNYLKWNKSRAEIERLRAMNRARVANFRTDVTHFTGPQDREPSKSKSKSNKKPPSTPLAAGESVLLEEFDTFWNIYPRKVGKQAAYVKYRAARKKADPATILGGLNAQLADMNSREKQYIPHAATWLHQERWADPIESTPEATELEAVLEANRNIRRMR